MKVLTALGLVAIASLGLASSTKTEGDSDKVLDQIKRMAGGTWRGTVGPNLPVALHFDLSSDGQLVEGRGTVGDPAKPLLLMHSRMSLDPGAKQIYYLDMHNKDTIYYGHVTMDGENLVWDFTEITGDHGHYINYSHLISDNHYESTLYQFGADGTKKKLHDLNLDRRP